MVANSGHEPILSVCPTYRANRSQTIIKLDKSNEKQGSRKCQLGAFSCGQSLLWGAGYSAPLVPHPSPAEHGY